MRYLFPMPMPHRWRRRMMAMGSGDPSRIICSALIAQAFDNVRYPILPKITEVESEDARQEILEIRHSSLYAPRDFDISPYFEVVKPTLQNGFDYRKMQWADMPVVPLIGDDPLPQPEDAPRSFRSRATTAARSRSGRSPRSPIQISNSQVCAVIAAELRASIATSLLPQRGSRAP